MNTDRNDAQTLTDEVRPSIHTTLTGTAVSCA